MLIDVCLLFIGLHGSHVEAEVHNYLLIFRANSGAKYANVQVDEKL